MAGPLRDTGEQPLTPVEQFRIAYQADGSTSPRYDGSRVGTVPVVFSFKKRRKIDRLLEILSHLPWAYDMKETKSNQRRICVNVPVDVGFSKTLTEVFSLEGKPLSWCIAFIEEVAEWDGHRVKENPARITYSSVIESNTDFVQAVASLCGYRTKYTLVQDDRSETYKNIHRLFISRHQNTVVGGSMSKTKKTAPAPVQMYGIEVPSGFILIRDGKSVSITGNSQHIRFGQHLIQAFREQHPECFTEGFLRGVRGLFQKVIDLEADYIRYCLPDPILGYSAEDHIETAKWYADLRLKQMDLPPLFNAEHRFPWMGEQLSLLKEKNFFETRPTEYRTGGALKWDEE